MAGTHFDLNELEAPDDPGPFTFTFGDRDYKLLGPTELDWEDLLTIIVVADGDAPTLDAVKAALTLMLGDDAEAFWANRLPAFKLNALLGAYVEHFPLPKAGKASASSPGSNGTGRASKRTSRSAA